MARTFGEYSPAVPLGVTWEESILIEDEDCNPIDLAGYSVYAQLRDTVPVTDPVSGAATVAPVLELTSAGYYGAPPPWPAFEALSIPNPTDGTVIVKLDVDDLWKASPSNAKRKLVWSIVLVNVDTGYAIPVVQGKVTLLPANSIRPRA